MMVISEQTPGGIEQRRVEGLRSVGREAISAEALRREQDMARREERREIAWTDERDNGTHTRNLQQIRGRLEQANTALPQGEIRQTADQITQQAETELARGWAQTISRETTIWADDAAIQNDHVLQALGFEEVTTPAAPNQTVPPLREQLANFLFTSFYTQEDMQYGQEGGTQAILDRLTSYITDAPQGGDLTEAQIPTRIGEIQGNAFLHAIISDQQDVFDAVIGLPLRAMVAETIEETTHPSQAGQQQDFDYTLFDRPLSTETPQDPNNLAINEAAALTVYEKYNMPNDDVVTPFTEKAEARTRVLAANDLGPKPTVIQVADTFTSIPPDVLASILLEEQDIHFQDIDGALVAIGNNSPMVEADIQPSAHSAMQLRTAFGPDIEAALFASIGTENDEAAARYMLEAGNQIITAYLANPNQDDRFDALLGILTDGIVTIHSTNGQGTQEISLEHYLLRGVATRVREMALQQQQSTGTLPSYHDMEDRIDGRAAAEFPIVAIQINRPLTGPLPEGAIAITLSDGEAYIEIAHQETVDRLNELLPQALHRIRSGNLSEEDAQLISILGRGINASNLHHLLAREPITQINHTDEQLNLNGDEDLAEDQLNEAEQYVRAAMVRRINRPREQNTISDVDQEIVLYAGGFDDDGGSINRSDVPELTQLLHEIPQIDGYTLSPLSRVHVSSTDNNILIIPMNRMGSPAMAVSLIDVQNGQLVGLPNPSLQVTNLPDTAPAAIAQYLDHTIRKSLPEGWAIKEYKIEGGMLHLGLTRVQTNI